MLMTVPMFWFRLFWLLLLLLSLLLLLLLLLFTLLMMFTTAESSAITNDRKANWELVSLFDSLMSSPDLIRKNRAR